MKTGNWDPDMWHQKKKPPGIDMSDIKTSKDSTSGGSGSGDRPSSASEIHTKVAHDGFFSKIEHLNQTDFFGITQANFEANSADFHCLTQIFGNFKQKPCKNRVTEPKSSTNLANIAKLDQNLYPTQ